MPDIPECFLLANENLAFTVALNIVELFKRKDHPDFKNYTLSIPGVLYSGDGNDFASNTIKGLYYIKNIDDFDIFAYSTIYFLLEYCTDNSTATQVVH